MLSTDWAGRRKCQGFTSLTFGAGINNINSYGEAWVPWDCEGSASTQEHAHHTKWVFTLICTYIFISHTGQNSVALLQYGVAFWYFEAKGKCCFISLYWYSVDISYLHEIIYNVFRVNSSTKLPQRLLYLSSEGIYEGYCQLNVCGKQIWAGAETRR